jgi:S-adenosylmethionine/arginine decarboxylase-like enzyme
MSDDQGYAKALLDTSSGPKTAGGLPSTGPNSVKDPFIKALKSGIVKSREKPPLHTPAQAWGFHLLVDCVGMNKAIDDEKDIEAFFTDLINALDMTPLTEFFCVKVNDKKDGRGISAFQMITTSHIAMHFDDAGHNGFMDVFSCKEFDPKIVLKMIEEHFKPKNTMVQFVYRDTGIVKDKGDTNYEAHNTI